MSENHTEQADNQDWFVIDDGDEPELPPEFAAFSKPGAAPDAGGPGDASPPPAGAAPPTGAGAAAAPADSAELADLREKLLRVSAELENFKKRAGANRVTALEQQLMAVARDLLPVLDHFDRATGIDAEATSTADLLAGVYMVRDELMRALERYGIQRIDAQPGDTFDPNRHQAMMRQPSEDVEPEQVAQQFQPGYSLKEMTIRPAGVSVAEGKDDEAAQDGQEDSPE